jgi:hypothetical protein
LPCDRFRRNVLPCFVICACLVTTSWASDGQKTASNAPSSWMEDLWNLPILRHFFAPQAGTPASPPVAPCSVEPLPDIVDAEALAFERSQSPDTAGLQPAMARALKKFRQLVSMAGGSFELKSAYRPPAYQAHLQEVWYKWMLELRNNREPGCQALRAQVGDEFSRHDLLETQKPVTSSDHTRGLAFDATVVMPRLARLKKHRVSLDGLALLAGIKRPDILHDPVHFKLAPGRYRHA